MGLGKTLITLWWLDRNEHKALPALVVCLASQKYMWQHEARSVMGIEALVLEGKSPQSIRLNDHKMVIINYDILQYWKPLLKNCQFQTLVLDECQTCKNPMTKRTKACKDLAKGIPYMLALSGTPLTNRPIELFPVLNMLKPSNFPSRFNFGKKYCDGRLGHWGWEFKGATRTRELHDLLIATCMSRRLKSEVLKDLPEKNRCVLLMPMKRPEEYEEATYNFIAWLAKQDPLKAAAALRAQTLVQLGYLKRLAAKLKVKYVVGWINQWLEENEDDKFVLFAEHKGMVKVLKKRCKAKSLVIEGSTPSKKRFEYEQLFQTDKSYRLLIANRKAAGTGYTFTAASSLGFVELGLVPGDHTQAEDRIHRIGQNRTSWIYYFVAMGSIEEKLCSILQSKQKVLDAVLDGKKTNNDLNVYDQLLQQYKRGGK